MIGQDRREEERNEIRAVLVVRGGERGSTFILSYYFVTFSSNED